MSFAKCFDVVSMVVDEATNQFSPLWVVDKEKYEILKQYCSTIDSLADEYDGESIDVEVNEIDMTVSIILECADVTVQNDNHIFYELVKRACSLGFSVSENGNLNVKFIFPSVWNKVLG